MDAKEPDSERIDVNFESHPPIEDDLDGVAKLLRQTFLQYADCSSLARYLIDLKDTTQVIALEAIEGENASEDDEPDDDIYGVTSVIELVTKNSGNKSQVEAHKQLTRFLTEKSSAVGSLLDSTDVPNKLGLIINERYINLPPQLSLPTLKNLTQHLDKSQFSHLIFVSKILLKSRSSETKLPSKRTKSGESSKQQAEPIIYINPEEEIVFDNAKSHSDVDVSAFCDENSTWSMGSDVKYIPHRRIMIIDYKDWPKIMSGLEEELK